MSADDRAIKGKVLSTMRDIEYIAAKKNKPSLIKNISDKLDEL